MHDKIVSFLDSVCVHIKHRAIHKEICDELALHINELQEEFLAKTQTEEDALDMAIAAMGDPAEIGERLNKQHRPQTEWSIVILSAAIAFIGAAVNYASRDLERSAVNWESYLFSAALGTILLLGLYFFDYTRLKKFSWHFYLGSLAILGLFSLYGYQVNGVQRWIVIGGRSFSIAFIIVPLIIAFAGFIASAKGKATLSLFKLSALAILTAFLLLFRQFSLAFAFSAGFAVLSIVAVFRNHFGGKRPVQIIFLGVSACLFCLFVLWVFLFFRSSGRIEVFLSRGQSDPTGMGYQVMLADKWLEASSMFGAASQEASAMGTTQALPPLPEITTDFALINVFVSFGRVAGVLLIVLVALFIIRLFIVSFKIKNTYGFYLSLAACAVLAAQFTSGIMVNLNLLPTIGNYIPFISYGGTGYVSSMILIGIVLSVWRRNNLLPSAADKSAKTNEAPAGFIQYEEGKITVHLKK